MYSVGTYGASNQRLKTVDGTSTNTWYVWEGGKAMLHYLRRFTNRLRSPERQASGNPPQE